jgi:hypothetical protein
MPTEHARVDCHQNRRLHCTCSVLRRWRAHGGRYEGGANRCLRLPVSRKRRNLPRKHRRSELLSRAGHDQSEILWGAPNIRMTSFRTRIAFNVKRSSKYSPKKALSKSLRLPIEPIVRAIGCQGATHRVWISDWLARSSSAA